MAAFGGFIGMFATINTYTCDKCGYKLEQRAIYKQPDNCPNCGASWANIKEEGGSLFSLPSKKQMLIAFSIGLPILVLAWLFLLGIL
jgi:hypothetical protein